LVFELATSRTRLRHSITTSARPGWRPPARKVSTLILGGIAAAFVVLGLSCSSSYNNLVALDQGVSAQWAQVENVYQRRADLVPNLVETVKGAANFEKSTIVAVTEARSQVGSS
jgi:LemA protein